MNDLFSLPDCITDVELVTLVINYEFLLPIYHADDFGHVQVEIPPQTNPYELSSLICRLDKKQQWPALITSLSKQSNAWLLSFSDELQKETGAGVLNCLVRLTDFLASSDDQITHLQHAHEWPWSAGSVALLLRVKNSLNKIECGLLKEHEASAEIDLSIVRHTLAGLSAIEKNVAVKSNKS